MEEDQSTDALVHACFKDKFHPLCNSVTMVYKARAKTGDDTASERNPQLMAVSWNKIAYNIEIGFIFCGPASASNLGCGSYIPNTIRNLFGKGRRKLPSPFGLLPQPKTSERQNAGEDDRNFRFSHRVMLNMG
ncbi:hypothetical protein IV203_001899 [Nitzschia inconspicua]|uniref:Uncharacterized protein n=1 Tax=Nitzschia inconspicua TaxID=303405 RepID=A0A9K3LA90_9STRA|nr:hypothetical protein IV203_001899 [Nitzschia inconspicua]